MNTVLGTVKKCKVNNTVTFESCFFPKIKSMAMSFLTCLVVGVSPHTT